MLLSVFPNIAWPEPEPIVARPGLGGLATCTDYLHADLWIRMHMCNAPLSIDLFILLIVLFNYLLGSLPGTGWCPRVPFCESVLPPSSKAGF
jgi:hypothetical protein